MSWRWPWGAKPRPLSPLEKIGETLHIKTPEHFPGSVIEYKHGDQIPVRPQQTSELAQVLDKLGDIARTNGLILEGFGDITETMEKQLGNTPSVDNPTGANRLDLFNTRLLEAEKSIDELTAVLANAIVFVPVGEAKKIKAKHGGKK